MVALAALFAQSDQTVRSAERGEVLQAAEGLLGSTATLRAATSVALLVGQSVERGSDQTLRDDALSDLSTSAGEVERRARTVVELDERAGPDVTGMADSVVSVAREIEMLIGQGDIELAGTVAAEQLLPKLDALEIATSGRRDDMYALLQAEKGTAGSMARVASISVAFLVPAGAVVVIRSRQRRQEERRELEFEVESERQRRRVKDEMVASLGHELRTPLTGIYGAAMAIQDVGREDQGLVEEMTGAIVEQSIALSRMVDDLLVVAKVEDGRLDYSIEAVDVMREVESAALAFQRITPVMVDCAPGIVTCDSLRLRHALTNLLANAHTHGGPAIAVLGEEVEDRYRIMVVDDGDGVPGGTEERLFERFVHDAEAPLTTGSVGLGLAVARELLEGMGGEVRYRRIDGLTVFEIDLVRRADALRAPESAAAV